jgi:hypothetical protein
MQGFQSGNLDRPRGRWEGKPRAAAVIGVLALVILALVACSSEEAEHSAGEEHGTAVSGSSPTASQTTSDQTPSSSVGTEEFDSPFHRLSIGYPSGWQTRPATEPWGHDALAFGAPDVDVIFSPTLKEDLYLAVVSEPLDGTSPRDWPGDVWTDPSVVICNGSMSGGDDRLDGNYGYFYDCDRDSVAIIATATRGYIIYLHVGDEVPATYPVPAFADGAFEGGDDFQDGILETLNLRPEGAPDASNRS